MKRQRIIIESIRYITGNQKSVKLKGKISEMTAYRGVLRASKRSVSYTHLTLPTICSV